MKINSATVTQNIIICFDISTIKSITYENKTKIKVKGTIRFYGYR